MTIQNFRKASKLGQAGFTLVEIVMALILLGILAAVAVAKYFDLQEEAETIKCQYHRSLVLKTLQQRWAINKIDETVFSGDIDKAINEVMRELGDCDSGSVCEKLCPQGGTYYVAYLNSGSSPKISVKCSKHGSTGSDRIEMMVDWLVGDGTTNQAFYNQVVENYSIDKYFTWHAGNGGQGVINSSDAILADGKLKQVSMLINQALEKQGFDPDSMIWKLERETAKPSHDDGGRWHSILTLTVADKNDSNPTSAKTRIFVTDIYYVPGDAGAPVDQFVRQAEKTGTANISNEKIE